MTARVPVMVGAYAALPAHAPIDDHARYVRLVLELPGVDGLELPLMIDQATDERWLEWTPAGRPSAVTVIPAFAIRGRQDPGFGLASHREDGRAAAVELIRELHGTVRRWRDHGRELTVIAVPSAPQMPDLDAAERAFEASLREIRSWDWGPTRLVVEHCDARRAGREPEKGYLPLDREVNVIARTDDAPTECGLAVNWARSVIEHRDVGGASRDIEQVHERLRGFILSGVSDHDTGYGPAWADAHTPVVPRRASTSLLTTLLAREALSRLPRGLWYLAVKTAAKPDSLTMGERIALVTPAVELLAAARDGQADESERTA
ncbi:DUF4862 family protein [Agromyces silvae]|uniref:DUF4862 family protein n=1 Tax=Agromyces silvae TaxID=3388266 RepID=UPI00280C2B14|nr:DUF4862 family protein [Agromyces protaetiae]